MCELNSVFRALADKRRRSVLCCLQKHQTVTLPDLAEHVAEQERETDVTAISEEWVRDLYLLLYHTHIPKLEEAGLVRYDQAEDLVIRTDQVASALERVQDVANSLRRTS